MSNIVYFEITLEEAERVVMAAREGIELMQQRREKRR